MKRPHNSDNCLSLTQDSNLSQASYLWSIYYVRMVWGFLETPTPQCKDILHKVRENCHFLNHLPPLYPHVIYKCFLSQFYKKVGPKWSAKKWPLAMWSAGLQTVGISGIPYQKCSVTITKFCIQYLNPPLDNQRFIKSMRGVRCNFEYIFPVM